MNQQGLKSIWNGAMILVEIKRTRKKPFKKAFS